MAYWGVDVWLQSFLSSAPDGGELSASFSDGFNPEETTKNPYLFNMLKDYE
jgi:hypothetical protein